MVTPAEIILGLGIGAGARLRAEAPIGVEGMFGALPFLLIGELAARRLDARHRGEMGRIRPRGRRGRWRADRHGARRAGDLQARGEAFQKALLFGGKVLTHEYRSGLAATKPARPVIREGKQCSNRHDPAYVIAPNDGRRPSDQSND